MRASLDAVRATHPALCARHPRQTVYFSRCYLNRIPRATCSVDCTPRKCAAPAPPPPPLNARVHKTSNGPERCSLAWHPVFAARLWECTQGAPPPFRVVVRHPLSYLDLFNNALTGTVPAFSTSVDLDLSTNCFTNCTAYPDRAAACPCDAPSASPGEVAALVALYEATNGANWDDSTNWNTGDPCVQSWLGVSCSGRVPVNSITYVPREVVRALLSHAVSCVGDALRFFFPFLFWGCLRCVFVRLVCLAPLG